MAGGQSPAHARELLDDEQAHAERVLLEVRLADGLDLAVLDPAARRAVGALVADGLLDGRAALAGRGVLTLRGRMLADTVVRALLP